MNEISNTTKFRKKLCNNFIHSNFKKMSIFRKGARLTPQNRLYSSRETKILSLSRVNHAAASTQGDLIQADLAQAAARLSERKKLIPGHGFVRATTFVSTQADSAGLAPTDEVSKLSISEDGANNCHGQSELSVQDITDNVR